MQNKKIYYEPNLTELARALRNNATKSEIRLWCCLRNKQLMGYDFHRQKPIGNFICDLFCYDLMLVIELDGLSHGFDGAAEKDTLKEQYLESIGITVLRFRDNEVMADIKNVLLAITNWIEMKQLGVG